MPFGGKIIWLPIRRCKYRQNFHPAFSLFIGTHHVCTKLAAYHAR